MSFSFFPTFYAALKIKGDTSFSILSNERSHANREEKKNSRKENFEEFFSGFTCVLRRMTMMMMITRVRIAYHRGCKGAR